MNLREWFWLIAFALADALSMAASFVAELLDDAASWCMDHIAAERIARWHLNGRPRCLSAWEPNGPQCYYPWGHEGDHHGVRDEPDGRVWYQWDGVRPGGAR